METENQLESLFISGNESNFFERILSQIKMIFTKPGTEGGHFFSLEKILKLYNQSLFKNKFILLSIYFFILLIMLDNSLIKEIEKNSYFI